VPPFPARESLRSVTGIEENRTEDAVDHAAPGQNIVQYTSFPDDVVEAFVRADAEAGRDVSRVFDALNDTRNLKTAIQTVLDCGKHARGEICYTTSPVHPIDAFIKMEGGSSGTWDATRLGLRIWPES